MRWLDAEYTKIASEDGRTVYQQGSRAFEEIVAAGSIAPYRRFASLDAAKAELTAVITARARALRIAVAGTDDATKLAAYREKYAIAIEALDGDQGALAMLAPEASARAETPNALATLVKALGDQWRAAGIAIDAAYQGHKGAIAALEDVAEAEAYDADSGWPF